MHRNSVMHQFTVGEVASQFKVTDKTVAKWIGYGALKGEYYPNEKPSYLVSQEAIDIFKSVYGKYLDRPRGRGCELIPLNVLKSAKACEEVADNPMVNLIESPTTTKPYILVEDLNDSFGELLEIRKKMNDMDKSVNEVWDTFLGQQFASEDIRLNFMHMMRESPEYKQLAMEYDTKRDMFANYLKNAGVNADLVDAMLFAMTFEKKVGQE